MLRSAEITGGRGNPFSAIGANVFRTTNCQSRSAMRAAEFHGNTRRDGQPAYLVYPATPTAPPQPLLFRPIHCVYLSYKDVLHISECGVMIPTSYRIYLFFIIHIANNTMQVATSNRVLNWEIKIYSAAAHHQELQCLTSLGIYSFKGRERGCLLKQSAPFFLEYL